MRQLVGVLAAAHVVLEPAALCTVHGLRHRELLLVEETLRFVSLAARARLFLLLQTRLLNVLRLLQLRLYLVLLQDFLRVLRNQRNQRVLLV
jgi:hypothetical protein